MRIDDNWCGFICWLMLIDADWYLLMLIGDDWCWLVLNDLLFDTNWCWLMLIDVDWCRLMLIDAGWCWLINTDDWWLIMLLDAQIRSNQVLFCRSVPPEFLRSFFILVGRSYLSVWMLGGGREGVGGILWGLSQRRAWYYGAGARARDDGHECQTQPHIPAKRDLDLTRTHL